MQIILQDMQGNTLEVIDVPDKVFNTLSRIAEQQGVPVEDLIREAIHLSARRALENEQNET